MDSDVAKSEILLSLKQKFSWSLNRKWKTLLQIYFDFLKKELHALKADVQNDTLTICSEIYLRKTTVDDMETGLSTWADKVVSLQTTVNSLKTKK